LYELDSYDYKENNRDLSTEREIEPLEGVIYYKKIRKEEGEEEE